MLEEEKAVKKGAAAGGRVQDRELVLPEEIKVELMTDKQREELSLFRFPVQKILKE